jgi:hypothetical protein
MNRDHEPTCTGCGVDSPLANTNEYGWICDSCLNEFIEAETLDIESYERKKYERMAEQNER